MSSQFPIVGVYGTGALVQLLDSPATSLGLRLVNVKARSDADFASCSVVTASGNDISIAHMRILENFGATLRPNSSTLGFVKSWNDAFEKNGDAKFSVLVARSPHGQASAWAPTELVDTQSHSLFVTPAPSLSAKQIIIAQELALNLAKDAVLAGVMEVELNLKDGMLVTGAINLGPTNRGVWTIEGARTSQFEQHLRAILDLPLGDPSLCQRVAVTGSYFHNGNMYRPYLHLMARSPGLKFHQYPPENAGHAGHVTALGADLLDLQECVSHAVEYMNGVIDE